MSGQCIFCRIIAGELPVCKVYEDADVVAMLDINPVEKGHTLVIPKVHSDPITNTPDAALQKLIVVVRKVARAQVKALKVDGLNVSQANGRIAGQVIPHIHFHVIPRSEANGGVRNWTSGKYDSQEELELYGRLIRDALE